MCGRETGANAPSPPRFSRRRAAYVLKSPRPVLPDGDLGAYNIGALRNWTILEASKGVQCTPIPLDNEIVFKRSVPILLFLIF